MNDESIVLRTIIGLLYPFMLLFGFYVILNGQFTPGGGFQGGSVLATLFVARYVIFPVDDVDRRRLHAMQRVFFSFIFIAPTALLFSGVVMRYPVLRSPYLMLMDALIGIQVGLELGVAVLRFAFFQGVGQTWRL